MGNRIQRTLNIRIKVDSGIPIDFSTSGSSRYLINIAWYEVVDIVSSRNKKNARKTHASLAKAATVTRGRVIIRKSRIDKKTALNAIKNQRIPITSPGVRIASVDIVSLGGFRSLSRNVDSL